MKLLIKEVCSCGASFEIESDDDSSWKREYAEKQILAFRKEHLNCIRGVESRNLLTNGKV